MYLHLFLFFLGITLFHIDNHPPLNLCPPPTLVPHEPFYETHWSSSVIVRMSVTRPVPMVLLPSRRVNLWPFSRTIGCRSVRVKEVSSPGITISLDEIRSDGMFSSISDIKMLCIVQNDFFFLTLNLHNCLGTVQNAFQQEVDATQGTQWQSD